MTSAANPGLPEAGHGERLREARSRAGLSVEQVAGRMRVPVRVVEALEADDWDRLGAPVFVRGQIRSYARALGLAADALLPAGANQPVQPATLQPRTYTSRLQRFAEQASRRLVYAVITAAIAVPVWMVTRQHVEGDARAIATLDVDPASLPGAAPAQSPVPGAAGDRPAAPAHPQRPFVASMTPPIQRAPATPRSAELSLTVSGESWVQVIAPDGTEIEQALLRAGESRRYPAGQVGRVVLGNAGAVEVRRGDEVQDIAPFMRANVARFAVSSDGSLAPLSE
ncbi:helix-turn-helix domain-containing protein [Luteimonas huabeiensis]|uniref:helix-turn-helix domain-containing protein n=1 Tax=Luteimonas huabeiensis TaxID=1244513 RepID=UPI000467092A|nr:RodZ domain-containing protein [Luteimonas huabeiensis]